MSMKTPTITDEFAEWVEQVFDVPPRVNDSTEELRWKAAQRDVVIKIKALHKGQKEGLHAKTGSRAEQMGFHLRPKDF